MRLLAVGTLLALALGFASPAQAPRQRHRAEAERAFRAKVGGELRRLHRVQDRLRGAVARGVPYPLSKLMRVVACESNWEPSVVSPSGTYRGLGQFDAATWRSVGGRGDPAQASVPEQLGRMLLLVAARGWQPWPQCGRP